MSSAEQVQGTSLEQQEAECRLYCQREGLNIAAVFVDRGESAKTANRPEFLKMVAFCRDNRIDASVVWKVDRFSRSALDYAVYQAVLAKEGVEIRSVTEPLNESPAGKLMQTMLAGIAQFDNDVRAERSRAGMASIARQGGWTQQAPIGFVMARTGGVPVLAEDPVTGPYVREMFVKIAAGDLMVRDAARWLEPRVGRRIHIQNVHKILRNPVYVGLIINSLTDFQCVTAAFPGIVPKEQWDTVQDVLRSGMQNRGQRPTDRFPLRGYLTCGCGKAFTASESQSATGRKYAYYHCRCGFRVAEDAAEKLFDEYLREMAAECSVLLPLFMEVVRDTWQQFQAESIIEGERYRKSLVQVRGRLEKLLDLYLAGDISPELYKQKRKKLELDEALLRTQVSDSEIDELDAEAIISLGEQLFSDLPYLFRRTPAKHRKRLMKGVFGGALRIDSDLKVSNSHKTGIINALRPQNLQISPMAPPRRIGCSEIKAFFEDIRLVADLLAA